MPNETISKDFVAVPIQVDGRGISERFDGDGEIFSLVRPSYFDVASGRESMYAAKSRQDSCTDWIPKKAICQHLDSWQCQLLTFVLVLYSLFVYNISVLAKAADSANPWLNATLIFCIVIFFTDILLNAVCRPQPPWIFIILDFVATATILVDLSWVADAANLNASNGSRTSDAAIISAQAARVIRLVRLLRMLRVVSLLSTGAKRAMQQRKAADAAAQHQTGKGAPSNIGGKLTDALVMQVSLVVIATVISTALLTSWGVEPSPLDAYVSSLQVSSTTNATREELQHQVDALREFAKDNLDDLRVLTLRVGAEKWSWLDEYGGYPSRSSSLGTFKSDEPLIGDAEPTVSMEVDISNQNSHDALLDILVIVMVLCVLLIFVTIVNITIYKTLVRPLERIFNTIRTNAAQVMAALGPADTGSEEDALGDEDGDIGTIEAAVEKMSRILAHAAAPGGQNAVRMLAQDADHTTKEWLATMVGSDAVVHTESADNAGGKHALSSSGPSTSSPLAGRDSTTTTGGGGLGAVVSNVLQGARSRKRTSISSNKPILCERAGLASPVAAEAAAAQYSDARESGGSLTGSTGCSDQLSIPSRPGTGSFGALSCAQVGLAGMPFFGAGLSETQRQRLLKIDVNTLRSFSLDVLSLEAEDLAPHVVAMFLQLGLAHFGQPQPSAADDKAPKTTFVEVALLWRFVDAVSEHYRQVPYHNFYHCVDVTHATFLLVDRLRVPAALTPLECFSLMVAAVAHDMDHPGVNNGYLVNARDTLAVTYNDASVLENRHVACLYALLSRRPDLDIFKELDLAQWKDVRRMIIAAVLHTDMTQHFAMVSQLEVFYELHAADIQAAHAAQRAALRGRSAVTAAAEFAAAAAAGGVQTTNSFASTSATAYHGAANLPNIFNTQEERVLLLSTILHCADISNPARPSGIADKWADRVLSEFFAQGDLERSKGQAISPLCDRNSTSKPGSQVNFIEFVVAPLFAILARIFPDAGELIANTSKARQHWQAMLMTELASGKIKEEEVQKAEVRHTAFQAKYKDALAITAKRRNDVVHRLNSMPSQGGRTESNRRPVRSSGTWANTLSIFALPSIPRSARTSASSAGISEQRGKLIASNTPAAASPLSPNQGLESFGVL